MSIAKIRNVSFTVKEEINNGMLKTTNAMPQKDGVSDNNSSFSADRRAYEKTFTTKPLIIVNKPAFAGIGSMFNRNHRNPTVFDATASANQKRFFRNTDASEVTRNSRVNAVGQGTLNTSGQGLSFESHANANTVNHALRRVRSGGAVAPVKKNVNKANAYTPARSYVPWVIPQRITNGVKMPPLQQTFGF